MYILGLTKPLNAVADELEAQDQNSYAKALRHAAIIVEVFAEVNLDKTAVLAQAPCHFNSPSNTGSPNDH